MPTETRRGVDRMLLLEVALVIVLGALAVYFYIIPAASAAFAPSWWVGFVLAILFFAVVVLETFRRRARSRAEIHGLLDQETRDDEDAIGS